MSLGLNAVASVADSAIHKKVFRSGYTTCTISNKKMNGVMKIVHHLKNHHYE